MNKLLGGVVLVLAVGCSSSDAGSNGGGAAGGAGSGGAAGAGGGAGSGGAGGSGGAAGVAGSGGSGGTGGGGSWSAGSADTSCKAGLPPEATPADVSSPTTVVGTGTAASCTFAALQAAVAKGGVITFDCGEAPVTIAVTATLALPIDKDTVLDGGRLITLDGQHQVQLLRFDSANWLNNDHRLTLQHIALANGKTTPTEAIPPAPAPCSQGFNDGEGGALYMRDGNLTVIDSIFTGNEAAPLGPDTGGGAIYIVGSKAGALVVGSTFESNAGSNAGALGALFAHLRVYDSRFHDNKAIGNGANNNDPSKCSAINNGQNEIGSGGNGGAVYSDGTGRNVYLCGVELLDNAAGTGAFGGGLFFTSNDMTGDLSILDSTITGNSGGHWTNVATGSIQDAGTAVGTNCHSITIESSTVQGYP